MKENGIPDVQKENKSQHRLSNDPPNRGEHSISGQDNDTDSVKDEISDWGGNATEWAEIIYDDSEEDNYDDSEEDLFDDSDEQSSDHTEEDDYAESGGEDNNGSSEGDDEWEDVVEDDGEDSGNANASVGGCK